ncbi:unknown protein [Microcystis aeruginosa NIES-843]|uniref:Uncharacterized protein n=1 Tax=Microcystis aeruginosa (strain NIES-843 / IAM M-2473) TaxID=449447 RepID=B0JWH5_MICAN|nr:unknown protein [Microcystis aeruginosa NIES-843]
MTAKPIRANKRIAKPKIKRVIRTERISFIKLPDYGEILTAVFGNFSPPFPV